MNGNDNTATNPGARGSTDKNEIKHRFSHKSSEYHVKRMKEVESNEGVLGTHRDALYGGVAAIRIDSRIEIGFSANDDTYSQDFAVKCIEVPDCADGDTTAISKAVADFIIEETMNYEREHLVKFMGIGISEHLYKNISPELPSRYWAEIDVVPVIFNQKDRDRTECSGNSAVIDPADPHSGQNVDEVADAMARQCVSLFGPLMQPRLEVGYRSQVLIDAGGRGVLTRLEQYKDTVGERTWNTIMKYVSEIKGKRLSAAFFSATPQGGGVALMRHALVRFFSQIGVDVRWYVPRPRPEVFRITKSNHNILQGVNNEEEKLSEENKKSMKDWIKDNAERYWLPSGGPLSARSDGGVDVVFIDDPQMPGLIPLAKEKDPHRQVLFRSHIQIRSDLASKPGTEANNVWQFLWEDIRHADVFISHPVKAFVPKEVDPLKLGYMPATTDWLDGLNKPLRQLDWSYQLHNYNTECNSRSMTKLNYPTRHYIIQVARFDASKGITQLVDAYGMLRRKYMKDWDQNKTPQLVICGHSSIDDPDAAAIFDKTMHQIEKSYPELLKDISVSRVPPVDQELNALMSQAKVACQLSSREGFEVKVSEALHKGIPTIVTRAGGLPLQIKDGQNGFLVEVGNVDATAEAMYKLFTDDKLYKRMSEYAPKSISDEVGTIGNAVCWLFLLTAMAKGEKLQPNGGWIVDLAREHAQEPWDESEERLDRDVTVMQD